MDNNVLGLVIFILVFTLIHSRSDMRMTSETSRYLGLIRPYTFYKINTHPIHYFSYAPWAEGDCSTYTVRMVPETPTSHSENGTQGPTCGFYLS
jgi:hypothetical protein